VIRGAAPLALLAAALVGCGPGSPSAAHRINAEASADESRVLAAEAKVLAAEARARAAHDGRSTAEAAVAEARAQALAEQAAADEARAQAARDEQAKADAQALADAQARDAKAAKDALAWWLLAFGAGSLVAAAGVAALGLWIGLSPRALGVAAAVAVAGLVSLGLGAAWSWLPWVSAGLLALVVAAVAVGLVRAARAVARFADADEKTPAGAAKDELRIKHAEQQKEAGIDAAVGWLRGRSNARRKDALAALMRRAGG
jgi:hypothetical protein